MKPIDILIHLEIRFIEKSPKITKKCVGMPCPFCSSSEYYLGIFRDKGNYFCWKCGASGSLYKLVHTLSGISWDKFKALISDDRPILKKDVTQQLKEIFNTEPEPEKASSNIKKASQDIPSLAVPIEDDSIFQKRGGGVLKSFLNKRKISLSTVIENNCFWGSYNYRLYIPIYDIHGRYFSYQSIDCSGKAPIAKLFPPDFDVNKVLYNIDRISDEAIMVEGIFDQWRLQPNSFCTFGTHISLSQIKLIKKRNINKLIIAWDGDAYSKALKLSWELSTTFQVKCIKFPPLPENPDKYHDPDSYGREATFHLINQTDWL